MPIVSSFLTQHVGTVAGWVRAGILATLFAAGTVPEAAAQSRPIRFDHLGLDHGLSQTTALVLHQDRRGFLWVGTEDGLNRYDGYRFRVYGHDELDTGSVPGDHIYAIAEDAAGDIWVGTDGGGVGRWSHETDRFAWFRKQTHGLSSDQVRAVVVDESGAVWIGTRDAGLNRLDPRTGQVQQFRASAPNSGLVNDSVFALTVAPGGTLWVGTDGGLHEVALERDFAIRRVPIGDDRIRALFIDRQHALWIGTQAGGLHRLEPGPAPHVRYSATPDSPSGLPSATVRTIFEDSEGRIWVGTAAGLALLDRATGTFSTYQHSETNPTSLSDDYVMSLLEDRSGMLWIGTRSGGLNRWNPASWRFGHVSSSAPNPRGLSHDNVTAFAVSRNGTLWVGTFGGGLNRFDRASGVVTHYRAQASPGGLSDDRVMSLLVDQRGRLWVGTFMGGLSRLDPGDTRFRTYRHDETDPTSLGADGVMVLHEDRRGNIWVGTFGGGLNRFDELTGSFVQYSTGPDPLVPSPRVTALADDVVGALWIGTDGAGVYRLEPDTDRVQHFRHDPSSTTSLPSDAISATHADPAGPVWLGTRGGGLVRLTWTANGPVWKAYTKRNGLTNEVVYGIEPDKGGHLWLSTNNGLFRFDPVNEHFTMFDASHGLQSNEFNFGAHYRAFDGQLFFGGIKGFNEFFPEHIVPNRHAPPVVLTSFLKFNQPVPLATSPHALDRVDVGYRDSVITFEFAALDFSSSENNQYRYRLEGFDDSWLELGSEHRVTYTNLDPGQYRLRVQAANNDGVWNEEGLTLGVSVEAPPWKRAWAYAIYVGFLGLIATTAVRASRAKHRREVEYRMRLETEVQERTQELALRNIELERLNGRLVDASLSDPMTGLRNRRFLFEHVVQEVDLLRRRLRERSLGSQGTVEEGTVFLIVDIDRFKQINDTLGHAAGDKVILEFVRRMQLVCRPTDVVIRWGGDEFLVIARDTSLEDACALAEELRLTIGGAPIEIGGGQVIPSSCSIGFAGFPFIPNAPQVGSWEETLAFADLALYAAKRGSRNAWAGCAATEQTPARLDQLLRESPETLERAGYVRIVRSIAFPGPSQIPRAAGQ